MNTHTLRRLSGRPETSRERRRSERIHVSMPVTLRLQLESAPTTFSASTLDLSELGTRIRTEAPLAPEQRLEVIPNEAAGEAVPARVVWVGAAGTAQAGQAGLEFQHSLSAPI